MSVAIQKNNVLRKKIEEEWPHAFENGQFVFDQLTIKELPYALFMVRSEKGK